jgi:hypothetical protein
VRVLAAENGLWLLVADAPAGRYSAAAIERGLRDLDWVSACALGHETVIERFTGSEAIAPMKLFTLFESDARAQAVIGRDRTRLERTLDRIAGREEWGVRVLLDDRRALARLRRETSRGRRHTGTSGASFLTRKKATLAASRELLEAGRRAMGPVFAELAAHADGARRRGPRPAEAGTRLLLDGAFLVPARRAARFRAAVRRIGRRLEPQGYAVALTGPWPAYSFVGDSP